jgi:hypothetical protein
MAKKIYDIKPPKVAHKIEKEIKEFLAGPGGYPKKAKQRRAQHKKEGRPVWLPV